MGPAPATAQRVSYAREQIRLRAVDETEAGVARRPLVVLRTCRPKQWLKNLVVLLPPAAAGALTRPSADLAVLGALVSFCLLASATYLINDVCDRESDRLHPRKRLRPIASGELSPRRALRIALLLAVAGMCTAVAVRPLLGVVAACYLALTLGYSFLWRDVAGLDIVVVATGFLIRAAAGGVATDVRLSKLFLLVTSACALFVVAGKRYAESRRRGAALTRETLRRYSPRVLRFVLVGAASVAAVAYALWAFTRPAGNVLIELSLVPFALWLGRYRGALEAGAGEAPEEVILGDRALVLIGAAWTILFLTGLYAAR